MSFWRPNFLNSLRIPPRPERGKLQLVSNGLPHSLRLSVFDGEDWLLLPDVLSVEWRQHRGMRATMNIEVDADMLYGHVHTELQRTALSIAGFDVSRVRLADLVGNAIERPQVSRPAETVTEVHWDG